MTLRAGRHLAYFGFAALIGALLGNGLQSAPAAAQSYLADNSQGSVTVDYSVLGGGASGPSGVTRSALPSGTLPGGTCSCAGAPLGVIAAAPRPTFNNPFGANLAMQAPAVPPGFMTYAQATGAPAYSGSSGAVVLHAPSGGSAPQMAEMQPAEPATTAPLPPTTETANAPTTEPAETQAAELPKSTPTQSGGATSPAAGTAATGGEAAPSQPDQMPAEVPSPVGPGDTVANVSQAPAPQPEAPSTESSTANAQSTEPTTNAQSTETPSTETPAATPPAEPSTEQQAAVTPAAPAPESGNAAPNGGALPAGAYRILYTGESDDVPTTANGDLDKVAAAMQADTNMRVQILAYAAGTEDTESKARRKSLARGLAIRSYLIKAGVPSTRIDVRALGSKADGGPADRVDIVPAS
ncbi:MAG TPA: OmpA family protein [Dongiaceae bacterium]|jgi:outer membrane protein OmpA-like peptidoglycan-associated protein|nr:OmpA family protein [Dongiaceae bacterium]